MNKKLALTAFAIFSITNSIGSEITSKTEPTSEEVNKTKDSIETYLDETIERLFPLRPESERTAFKKKIGLPTKTFIRVKELSEKTSRVKNPKITLETSFVRDLGFDSLDVVEFVLAAEKEFDINIDFDDEFNSVKTVGEMVEYIENKILINNKKEKK